MEKTCSYEICTGCGVCSVVCPTKCISFFAGDLGHIYPQINPKRCIDCKKCERACPALRDNKPLPATKAYAGIIKSESDYKTTTSGGAAQALSLMTIEAGGVVYGCASLSGCNIKHIRVTSREGLDKLKGSKYVQSEAWHIFDRLVDDVKSGKKVLFIGTPCQTASVKSLFRSVPSNLLLVDIICHGVPSRNFLCQYLRKNGVDISEIEHLRFRNGKNYSIAAISKKGRTIYETYSYYQEPLKDIYYSLFIEGYSYRPSCYTCRFATSERCSDITIGDFWGLGKEDDTDVIPPHEKGISVLLPVTEKGQKALADSMAWIDIYERPVSEAINGNTQLRHPTHRTVWAKAFNKLRKHIGVFNAAEIVLFARRLYVHIAKHF